MGRRLGSGLLFELAGPLFGGGPTIPYANSKRGPPLSMPKPSPNYVTTTDYSIEVIVPATCEGQGRGQAGQSYTTLFRGIWGLVEI